MDEVFRKQLGDITKAVPPDDGSAFPSGLRTAIANFAEAHWIKGFIAKGQNLRNQLGLGIDADADRKETAEAESRAKRRAIELAAAIREFSDGAASSEEPPLDHAAGRSPAEVPPNWKASDEVQKARAELAQAWDNDVQGNIDMAVRPSDLFDNLCAAVWRSAQQ